MQVKIEGIITIPDSSLLQLVQMSAQIKAPTGNATVDPEVDLGKNAGKMVFVSSVGLNEKGEPRSSYNDGEYLCLRQTTGTIYVVKPVVGYGGHDQKTFHLLGREKYEILDTYEDDSLVREFITGQNEFYEESKRGKKQWVDYVYTNARVNARAAQKALDFKNSRKTA